MYSRFDYIRLVRSSWTLSAKNAVKSSLYCQLGGYIYVLEPCILCQAKTGIDNITPIILRNHGPEHYGSPRNICPSFDLGS